MNRDYFEKKKEEILEKNISENDKRKELKQLEREEKERINSYEKKENIHGIFILIMLLLICPVAMICTILKIDPYVASDLVVIFIGFSYLLYKIYKIIKNKLTQRYWKSLVDAKIKDLQTMCEELSNSISSDLKKKRRKVKMKIFSVVLGIFLPWVLFVLLYLLFIEIFLRMDFMTELFTFVFILMYIWFVCLLVTKEREAEESYKSLYKREVISKFIGNASNELIYEEKLSSLAKIENDYKYAGFDIVNNDGEWKTQCEDNIFGKIDNDTNLEMSDIISKHRGNARAGNGSSTTLLFKGTFISLNINKTFGECKIIKNKINIFDKNELLNSDNEKFNKYFEIHAQNKYAVQNYLTPSLIEFLADFREKYKIDFEIIFKDKIYIRFYTRDMFEPKMSGKIVDEYSVYQYYVITKFAKELVEKLDNM